MHVDEKCRLQLRFSTTQLAPSYHSTPSNFDIKIPNKSTLSPSAPVFHYAFSSSQNSNIKTKAKVPVQSSLSSTAPVFECWPSMSKSNIATPKISCLSPMAPPFQYAHGDYKISNHTMAALSQSSLAPPKSSKVASSRDIPSNSNFNNNERRQYCRWRVQFPPYRSLVTIIHHHQCIPVRDKPALHYSREDMKRFRDSFRNDRRKSGGYVLEPVQKWSEQQSLFRQVQNLQGLTTRDVSSQPQMQPSNKRTQSAILTTVNLSSSVVNTKSVQSSTLTENTTIKPRVSMVNTKIIQSSTPTLTITANPSSSTSNTERIQPRASTTIPESRQQLLNPPAITELLPVKAATPPTCHCVSHKKTSSSSRTIACQEERRNPFRELQTAHGARRVHP